MWISNHATPVPAVAVDQIDFEDVFFKVGASLSMSLIFLSLWFIIKPKCLWNWGIFKHFRGFCLAFSAVMVTNSYAVELLKIWTKNMLNQTCPQKYCTKFFLLTTSTRDERQKSGLTSKEAPCLLASRFCFPKSMYLKTSTEKQTMNVEEVWRLFLSSCRGPTLEDPCVNNMQHSLNRRRHGSMSHSCLVLISESSGWSAVADVIRCWLTRGYGTLTTTLAGETLQIASTEFKVSVCCTAPLYCKKW